MSRSREEMEAIIKGGGSVLHGGVIHTSVGTLPDSADSIANAEKELAARKAKADNVEGEDETDLEKMSKVELIQFARANEIEIDSKAPKQEVFEAIQAALQEKDAQDD